MYVLKFIKDNIILCTLQSDLFPVISGKKYPAYEPLWFRNETDPQTGGVCHVFTEEYWKCKAGKEWDRCPDIYLSPEQLPPVPLTSGGTV